MTDFLGKFVGQNGREIIAISTPWRKFEEFGQRILDQVTREFYIRLEPPGDAHQRASSYYIGGFKWQEFGEP